MNAVLTLPARTCGPRPGRPSPREPSPPPTGSGTARKIYAHCIDGQADAANQRITDALGTTESESGLGGEQDDESEPAA
jgi:hypothetical protein